MRRVPDRPSGHASLADLPAVAGAEVSHRFVQIGAVRMHLAEAGEGPPVVLVHGWPQHWWVWRHVIPVLAGAGRRVICPDLRGFGWSDAPPGAYAKEELAADVVGLLDALGLEQADLAGHDWGGLAAFLVALHAPARVRRLLVANMIHPWLRPTGRGALDLPRSSYGWLLGAPVLGRTLTERTPALTHALLSAGTIDRAAFPRAEREVFSARLRDPDRARATAALYRTFVVRELPAILRGRYRAQRLQVPTLMLHGTGDPVVRRHMVADLPDHADDARVEWVEGCGHFTCDERGPLVARRALEHFA